MGTEQERLFLTKKHRNVGILAHRATLTGIVDRFGDEASYTAVNHMFAYAWRACRPVRETMGEPPCRGPVLFDRTVTIENGV